jgi:hypothetical protein
VFDFFDFSGGDEALGGLLPRAQQAMQRILRLAGGFPK